MNFRHMKFSENLTSKQTDKLASAYALAETCGYDTPHVKFVTGLALEIFDGLSELHHLGNKERFWLICAGILHSIGWVEGGKNHAKKAQEIILNTSLLHLKNKERLIIGSIARYHCGENPNIKNDHFAALQSNEQKITTLLSAILQVAEALDVSHKQKFTTLKITIKKNRINLLLRATTSCSDEIKLAKDRSKLLKKTLERDIRFIVKRV